jgi:hypothetical protein
MWMRMDVPSCIFDFYDTFMGTIIPCFLVFFFDYICSNSGYFFCFRLRLLCATYSPTVLFEHAITDSSSPTIVAVDRERLKFSSFLIAATTVDIGMTCMMLLDGWMDGWVISGGVL